MKGFQIMFFGKKKKDDSKEEAAPETRPAPPAPAAPAAPAPAAPASSALPAAPASAGAAASPAKPAAPPRPAPAVAGGAKSTQVSPAYESAKTVAANHIIVNAGQGRVVLDVASEITADQGDGKRSMPIDTRVVMSAATADRLQKALTQALAKLSEAGQASK